MSNQIDYRKWSGSYPALACYDSSSTLKRKIVLSELDNPFTTSPMIDWQQEEDAEPFMTAAHTVYEYPLGCRLVADLSFPVYAPEFSVLTYAANQGEGYAFTERDYWYLKEWRRQSGKILFYPHVEWAAQGLQNRWIVQLVDLSKTYPNGKMCAALVHLAVRGLYVTTTGTNGVPDEW